MFCYKCGVKVSDGAVFCSACGTNLKKPVRHTAQESDVTGGLIPYKNPRALISYYIGIFSILPVIGIVMGLAAVILGVQGLRLCSQHPHIKGSVHAWIGILSGTFFAVIWTALLVILIK